MTVKMSVQYIARALPGQGKLLCHMAPFQWCLSLISLVHTVGSEGQFVAGNLRMFIE